MRCRAGWLGVNGSRSRVCGAEPRDGREREGGGFGKMQGIPEEKVKLRLAPEGKG